MTLKHETVSWEKNEEASSKDMQKLDNLSHLSLPFVKVSFMLCCWPAPQSFWCFYIFKCCSNNNKKKKKKELRKSLFFSSLYATFQLFNFDAEEASFVGTFDFVCIPLSLSHSSAQEEVLYANFYLSSSRESSSSNSSLRKLHSL